MSIKVTFEFETALDASEFLFNHANGLGTSSPDPSAGVANSGDKPRGRGRPRKEAEVKPVDPTPASPATPAAATPEATATKMAAGSVVDSAPAVPFAALVEPLTALADKDLDAAVAILGKFGVKTARELKPEQFGAVLTEVNAALNKPAARASLI